MIERYEMGKNAFTIFILAYCFFCFNIFGRNRIQKLIKEDYYFSDIFILIIKFVFSIVLIIIGLYIYSNIKVEIDKEYIMSDEYYLALKSVIKIIIDIIIILLVSEYGLFLIILKSRKCKFILRYKRYLCCKKYRDSFNFIDIQ